MNDLISAVKTVLNGYAKFEGRSGRPEYWWFVLAYFITAIVVSFVGGVIGAQQLLTNILTLALIIPTVAVAVRRFHDIGKSGWWTLIGLIPLVGWIALIYFTAQPSVGPNEHGERAQPLAA